MDWPWTEHMPFIWAPAKLLPSSIQMNAKFLQIALQEMQVVWVCVQGLVFYFLPGEL